MVIRRISNPLLGAVFLSIFLASGASAQTTLYLNNTPTSGDLGGVYTSPYGISISSQNSASVPLICDDFATDIGVPSNWQANVTTLTTIDDADVSSLKFDNVLYNGSGSQILTLLGQNSLSDNVVVDYAIDAVLSAELMSLPNPNSLAGEEISYAIWSVFDQNPLYNNLIHDNGSTGFGSLTQSEVTDVTTYLTSAESAVLAAATKTIGDTSVNLSAISIPGGGSVASLTVYTPTPQSASQEFLQVAMPEPSAPAVLALDLLAAGWLIVAFRRRFFGIAK